MTTPFESLDNAFDLPSEDEEVLDITPTDTSSELDVSNKEEDREKDYQYARGQLYNIVEKMQETLNGAMEVAAQSDHPRAYEVFFAGAKHAADTVEKLQDLHKKHKELSKEDSIRKEGSQVNNGSVTNNVFMSGSTADLLKMLKDSQLEGDKDK